MSTNVDPAPVGLVEDPERAAALLQPVRLRILEGLREPASAASLARDLGLPRQRVGYHVRELEKEGFLRTVEERRRGSVVERLLQATARRFVVSPEALGPLGADPDEVRDRFSSSWLVSVACRTMRETALLAERARSVGKRLPTLTLETEIRFASPREQAEFAERTTEFFREMALRYHDEEAEGGRTFRITLTGHPALPEEDDAADAGDAAHAPRSTDGEESP